MPPASLDSLLSGGLRKHFYAAEMEESLTILGA